MAKHFTRRANVSYVFIAHKGRNNDRIKKNRQGWWVGAVESIRSTPARNWYLIYRPRNDERQSRMAEWLTHRVKCLAVFRTPLRSEFKPCQDRLSLSSFRGRCIKYQLRIGVNLID